MKTTYTYQITVVEDDDGTSTAYLDEADPDNPLRGHGESPLQAVRALCESIREWPLGGSDRWLDSPDGTKLARMFCPSWEPGKPGASS